jgi:hypothetical protein
MVRRKASSRINTRDSVKFIRQDEIYRWRLLSGVKRDPSRRRWVINSKVARNHDGKQYLSSRIGPRAIPSPMSRV